MKEIKEKKTTERSSDYLFNLKTAPFILAFFLFVSFNLLNFKVEGSDPPALKKILDPRL